MTDRMPLMIDFVIKALNDEADRQFQIREDRFGDADMQGARAASDLALAYRTAAAFLKQRFKPTWPPPKA